MKTRIIIVSLLLMPVLSIAVLYPLGGFRHTELKVLGEIPNFRLTERSGKEISKSDLSGRVWIASFLFTHCGGQCPLLCQKLKKIQSALFLKENFRLVSISVDPESDTPQALQKYATSLQANPYKWFFLTGDKQDIHQLIFNGFHLSDGSSGAGAANHSSKLVLVDNGGRIRGYYDGLDDGEVKQLIRDARHLLKQVY